MNLRAEGGTRRGNMGHLTRIANMVVQNLEKGPVQAQIADLIKGNAVGLSYTFTFYLKSSDGQMKLWAFLAICADKKI